MGIYEKNNCRILGKGQWISNDDIKSGLNNNDLIIGGTGTVNIAFSVLYFALR